MVKQNKLAESAICRDDILCLKCTAHSYYLRKLDKNDLFNQDRNSTETFSIQLIDSLGKRRNLSSKCS